MCGLFGGMTGRLIPREVEQIERLGIVSQFRGTDSTGVCIAMQPDKSNIRDYHIVRTLGPSGNLIYGKEYTKLDKSGSCAIIGHCRATTVGDINLENTHPFHHGNIIGTHNGTLGTFPVMDGKSDSNQFYEVLAAYDGDFKSVYRDILGIGDAFAFVWYDVYEDTLNMVRNEQRPLFYLNSTEPATKGTLMTYASEYSMLDFVRKSVKGSQVTNPKLVEPHTLYTWDIGNPQSLRTEKLNVATSHKGASPGTVKETTLAEPKKEESEQVSLFQRRPDDKKPDDTKEYPVVPFVNAPKKPEEEGAKQTRSENDGSKSERLVAKLPTLPVKDSHAGYSLILPHELLGLDDNADLDTAVLPTILERDGHKYVLRYVRYGGRLTPLTHASKMLRKGSAFSKEVGNLNGYNVVWYGPNDYILADEWDTEFVQTYVRKHGDTKICLGGLVYVHSNAVTNRQDVKVN